MNEIAKAGGHLYETQKDYTGLASIDPNDTSIVYLSTEIDPRNEQSLEHYEIFRGRTPDNGSTWTWESITYQSTVDNLRPLVPAWNREETALIWMRGTYESFTSWTTEVVALINPIAVP